MSLLGLITPLTVAACALFPADGNLDFDPNMPHHQSDGFVNRYPATPVPGNGKLLHWQTWRLD